MKRTAWMLGLALMAGVLRADEGPCRADREKFCKDVQPGEGRIIKCLMENESRLSVECRKKLEEKKARHGDGGGKKDACRPDLEKFCKDVKPGEGRLMDCLKTHESELSAACRDQMGKGKR